MCTAVRTLCVQFLCDGVCRFELKCLTHDEVRDALQAQTSGPFNSKQTIPDEVLHFSNYLHLSVTSKVSLHTAPVHMRQSAYRFSKLLHFKTVFPSAASM
jgi:hypothetical protein